jgi:dTDP-glucose pyrophosphorylase
MNFIDLIVNEQITIREVLEKLDINTKGTVIVVDKDNKLLGTVTDGDIRRALLRGMTIGEKITSVYHKDCYFFIQGEYCESQVKKIFNDHQVRVIPIVDKNMIVQGVLDNKEFHILRNHDEETPILIMAGGLGSRLKPLTDDIPKPMLKVGNKPILQTIIEQFRDMGYKKFLISVNYKADVIESYFKDGKDMGINITYIRESKRLGTAGAIKLAEKYIDRPFFVINGDILTSVNFNNMMDFHRKNEFAITIGSRSFELQVPYGVLNMDELSVSSLVEKPVYTYFVSGGVYVLNPSVIDYIPCDEYFDITKLIDTQLKSNQKVGSFPIHEYWMDIGKLEDYHKANQDIYKYFG